MKQSRLLFALLVIFLGLSGGLSAKENKLKVFSYYTSPPFSNEEGKVGLVAEFLQAIEQYDERLKFDLQIISRPKLNKILEESKSTFIVPFAHPLWFNDKNREKYLWSRPLYTDYNSLISHKSKPVEFKGLYSFIFQGVGTLKGFHIYLLDDLVEKGKAKRVDVHEPETLVQMIALKKIKMAVLPHAMAHYHTEKLKLQDQVYYSARPHQTYDRHLMLANASTELNGIIDEAIAKARQSGVFDLILKKYGY